LPVVRHHRVKIRREGDVPSNPIIILQDTPSVPVAANSNTPPQSPPQRPEKRPRLDSYTGIMTRSCNHSDDPDHSTSRDTSTQSSNNIALDCHLPVESSTSTVKENPQRVSPAPELFPTDEKVDPTISTTELVKATRGKIVGPARLLCP